MSAGKHTPGPLRAVEWNCHAPTTLRAGNSTVAECSGNGRSLDEDLADARRIAACWNACINLETEELEQIADAGGAKGSVPREEVVRLAQQRDELLAALRPFAEVDLRLQGVHHKFADQVLKARAAIAKAGSAS